MKRMVFMFVLCLLPALLMASYSPYEFSEIGRWVAFYAKHPVCTHSTLESHTSLCNEEKFFTHWHIGVVTQVRPESLIIDPVNLNGEQISGVYDDSFWVSHDAGSIRYQTRVGASSALFPLFFSVTSMDSSLNVQLKQGERVQKKLNALHFIMPEQDGLYSERKIQKISQNHSLKEGSFVKGEIVYIHATPYLHLYITENNKSVSYAYTKAKFIIDGFLENGLVIVHPYNNSPDENIYRVVRASHLERTDEGFYKGPLNFDAYLHQLKNRSLLYK